MADAKCPKCGAGIPAGYTACAYCRAPLGRGAGALPMPPRRRKPVQTQPRSRIARQSGPVGVWRQLVGWAWGDPFYAAIIVGLVLGVLLGAGTVVYLLLRGADLRETLPYAIPGSVLLLAAIILAVVKRGRREGHEGDREGEE